MATRTNATTTVNRALTCIHHWQCLPSLDYILCHIGLRCTKCGTYTVACLRFDGLPDDAGAITCSQNHPQPQPQD